MPARPRPGRSPRGGSAAAPSRSRRASPRARSSTAKSSTIWPVAGCQAAPPSRTATSRPSAKMRSPESGRPSGSSARQRGERAPDPRGRHVALDQLLGRAQHHEVLERERVAAAAPRRAAEPGAHEVAHARLAQAEQPRDLGAREHPRHGRRSLLAAGARRPPAARGGLAALRARGLALARARRGSAGLARRLEASLQRGHEVDDLLALLGRRAEPRSPRRPPSARSPGAPSRGTRPRTCSGSKRSFASWSMSCSASSSSPFLQLDGVAELDLVEAAHLVGVVEAVEHEPVLDRPDQDELLAAARREAADRHPAGREHGARSAAGTPSARPCPGRAGCDFSK